jgi:hypothetical protein
MSGFEPKELLYQLSHPSPYLGNLPTGYRKRGMDPAVEIHSSAWDPIHNTADWVSKILTSRNLEKILNQKSGYQCAEADSFFILFLSNMEKA